MKNRTILLLAILITGSFLSGYFGPWWAPAGFIAITAALVPLSVREAILAGSISLGIVFLGMALWMNLRDQADIIGKTGALLGGLSSFALIAVTALTGFISGMLAGWVGSVLGDVFRKNDKSRKLN